MNHGNCVWCEKKAIIHVGMPIGQVTESGAIVYPEDSASQSLQITQPFCAFHAPFVEAELCIWLLKDGSEGLYHPKESLFQDILLMSDKEVEKEWDSIRKTKGWKKNPELVKRESLIFAVKNGKLMQGTQKLKEKYGEEAWSKMLSTLNKDNIKKLDDLVWIEKQLRKPRQGGKK